MSLKKPDSRRSKAANEGAPRELPVPQRPTPPSWLDERCTALFESLVNEAVNASVPTCEADAVAFALAAMLTLDYQSATDAKMRARIGRDLGAALDSIGCSPRSRVRMGVKGIKKPSLTPTAKLLRMGNAL